MSHVNLLVVQNVLGLLVESGFLSKDLQPDPGESLREKICHQAFSRLVDDRSAKIMI